MEHVCVVLLLLLLSDIPLAQAGKDKETPQPTMPSVSPRPSPIPTSQPSTEEPTTLEPSEYPSFSPSGGPTPEPTPPPTTFSPAPTTTYAPSAQPTTTYAPTGRPTEEPEIVSVPMPELKFVLDVAATDDDGILGEQEANTAIVNFLTFFFSQGFYRDAFLFVALQTKLVDGADARKLRRHLQQQTDSENVIVTTLEVIGGVVSYNPNRETSNGNLAPVPTEDELSDILSAYFSLWGNVKLLEYFQDDGLPVVGVSQIFIDGDVILTGLQDGDRGGSDQASPANGDDDGDNPVAILAGSIVGAGVVVIVAVTLFVRILRRDKASQLQQQQQREMLSGMDGALVVNGDSNTDDVNKAATATKSIAKSSAQSMSGVEASLLPPAPPSAPTYSPIPEAYQEKTANPYATSATYADADATAASSQDITIIMEVPTKTTCEDDDDHDDDDDDIISESDGDIISVTESVHHQHDQGPLFANRSCAPETAPAATPVATTGKSSVRQQQAASHFQYDASRLDQVISNAKKQGEQLASK